MKEIKAFVPAKDYQVSKNFYTDLGFTMGHEVSGTAYFYFENCSFLLQDFYEEDHANNFMMHILVEDIKAWHEKIQSSGLIEKYDTRVTEVQMQPWEMLDFVLYDPSGVLWRFGQLA